MEVVRQSHMEEAARRIKALGPAYVVVKGGHLEEDACDLLFDGSAFRALFLSENRHGVYAWSGMHLLGRDHGELAKGETVEAAIAHAKDFVTRAISAGFRIGHGHAPLNHQVDL